MLEEFNHRLSAECEDIYSALVDDIVSEVLEHFVYRAIPEGNPECDEFVEYLGKVVYCGTGTLKEVPEVNYEAGQMVRAAIDNLDGPERFLVNCYFAENEDIIPSEDDIMHSVMENLDAVLYDIGSHVINGDTAE